MIHNILLVDQLLPPLSSHPTRSNDNDLLVSRCTSTCRENFYFHRIVKLWNSLPHRCKCSSSLSIFKSSLSSVSFSDLLRGHALRL